MIANQRLAWPRASAILASPMARHATSSPHVSQDRFGDVLLSDGPAPDRAEKMKLYAWLVGRWEMDVVAHEESGATHPGRGEIYAGWVLQGRAIQDVWMIPPLADRRPDIAPLPVAGNWYGTTLRIYDPQLDAWRILWNDPATGFHSEQVGRARGKDIVQEGTLANGAVLRWIFTDITANSFHWSGELSLDGGRTWRMQVECFPRRVA
jgi:hypothetical protein